MNTSQHVAWSTVTYDNQPESYGAHDLLSALEDGSFFTLDFKSEVLPIIQREFSVELNHLKTAKADKKAVPQNRCGTYGPMLYPEELPHSQEYYELDRTLTAIRALQWIHDDSEAGCKRFNHELTMDDWKWIRERFTHDLFNIFDPSRAEDLYALITSVIINDVGKDQHIRERYYEATSIDIDKEINHDRWLVKVVEAGMLPCMESLSPDLRKDILLGMTVAAESNLGQLAQAENVPASLLPFTRFRGNHRAWKLRFLEQILDLAGAHGHIDDSKATIFGAAVADGNRSSYKSADSLIFPEHGPYKSAREAWDANLVHRYDFLQQKGYTRLLDISQDNGRALLRLFTLGGVSDLATAEFYEDVILHSSLTAEFRSDLIASMNKCGIDQPAVQMTYLPAMLSGALNPLKKSNATFEQKAQALAEVLRYAVRVHTLGTWHSLWCRYQKITVIERDVFEVVRDYVKTPRFLENPSILRDAPVPRSGVANKEEAEALREREKEAVDARTARFRNHTRRSISGQMPGLGRVATGLVDWLYLPGAGDRRNG